MDQTAATPPLSREASELIAASPHAELVISPDLNIVACTDAYLRLLDVPREAIVGRPVGEAFVQGVALEAFISSLESVRRLRRPHRMSAESLVPSGSASPAARMPLSAVNMPILANDGRVTLILHSVEATCETNQPAGPGQSATALALEAAEARLRSILQTVPDAMIIIDERGRIESLSATAERLFGYSLDEVAGRNVSHLMPTPYREQHDSI